MCSFSRKRLKDCGFVFFSLFGFLVTSVGWAAPIDDWVGTNLSSLVDVYRRFHANPELSFQEEKTASRLATELEQVGAQVTQRIGGHGIVGILRNGDGPTLMLRCDLDGLPVKEETDLVYASKVTVQNNDGTTVGVMHACGHDIHITNLIGVARFLASHKQLWSGTVMLIGQPAEERGAGAKAMLRDGLFTRFPQPDFALALHVDATLEAGKVACRSGFALANVDSVDVTMMGRGGHGAYPHTTIDPIMQGAQLVVALQTIVSREIKPIEPAVVTVGSIHGGTKHNIIGNDCHLQITVRSYSDQVRTKIHEAIKRKAKGVALGAGAEEPTVKISEGTPALWNDPTLTNRISYVLKSTLGEQFVAEGEPSMGGEDFSRYGKEGVPILMIRLGAIDRQRLRRYHELGQVPPSLHSSKFYPDADETLRTGVRAMVAAALELLRPKK